MQRRYPISSIHELKHCQISWLSAGTLVPISYILLSFPLIFYLFFLILLSICMIWDCNLFVILRRRWKMLCHHINWEGLQVEATLILKEEVTMRWHLDPLHFWPALLLIFWYVVLQHSQIMRFCQSFMNEMYRYMGPDKVSRMGFCSLASMSFLQWFSNVLCILGSSVRGGWCWYSGNGISFRTIQTTCWSVSGTESPCTLKLFRNAYFLLPPASFFSWQQNGWKFIFDMILLLISYSSSSWFFCFILIGSNICNFVGKNISLLISVSTFSFSVLNVIGYTISVLTYLHHFLLLEVNKEFWLLYLCVNYLCREVLQDHVYIGLLLASELKLVAMAW